MARSSAILERFGALRHYTVYGIVGIPAKPSLAGVENRLQIVFLTDKRGRELLRRSLKKKPGDARTKAERALTVLERSTWQEAVESKLVSQLGKPDDTWVYEIQIGGKPAHRIAVLPGRVGDEQCLLVGEMVTRETLNNKHDKDAFMKRALEAADRWRE